MSLSGGSLSGGSPDGGQRGGLWPDLAPWRSSRGFRLLFASRTVTALDDWVGPGYSLPTPEMVEAVRMVASLEGVLLDPVYTGKGMACLIDVVRKGQFRKGQNIVFIHTGGSVGLFGYVNDFAARP